MIIVLNSKIFGTNLRYFRKKLGMSQKHLAELTQISVYTLRGLEHGIVWEVEAAWVRRVGSVFLLSGDDVWRLLTETFH